MKKLRFILIIFLTFALTSCTERNLPSCMEILGEIIAAEVGIPAGKVYSLTASGDYAEHLHSSLMAVLYGNGEKPVMADGWLDVAIFLPSSSHPCELAVFLCDSEDTATDTARMLCRRLDTLRISKGGGKFDYYLDNATVTITRNYVLFLVSSDVGNTLKIASKIIR